VTEQNRLRSGGLENDFELVEVIGNADAELIVSRRPNFPPILVQALV
jgi:hypothetical protein